MTHETANRVQRLIIGAALIATLWHPVLGGVLYHFAAWFELSFRGALWAVAVGISGAWLAYFLTHVGRDDRRGLFKADAAVLEQSIGLAAKLKALATSSLGLALFASFAIYAALVFAAVSKLVPTVLH